MEVGDRDGAVDDLHRELVGCANGQAILQAAAEHGEDDTGKDGLKGYLRKVAREDVKAFSGLLGRVLPLDVNAAGTFNVIIAGDDAAL